MPMVYILKLTVRTNVMIMLVEKVTFLTPGHVPTEVVVRRSADSFCVVVLKKSKHSFVTKGISIRSSNSLNSGNRTEKYVCASP